LQVKKKQQHEQEEEEEDNLVQGYQITNFANFPSSSNNYNKQQLPVVLFRGDCACVTTHDFSQKEILLPQALFSLSATFVRSTSSPWVKETFSPRPFSFVCSVKRDLSDVVYVCACECVGVEWKNKLFELLGIGF